ncbi:DUF3618 domain-containing protein [Streptomyces xantholiticus]
MTTPRHSSNTEPGSPSAEELREQVEHTREELGETVEAFAAKADVKSRVKQTAAGVKDDTGLKVAHAKEQVAATAAAISDKLREKTPPRLQDTAHQAAEMLRDKTPQPVHDKAHQATQAARGNPKLLAGAAALAVVLLMLVKRRSRR